MDVTGGDKRQKSATSSQEKRRWYDIVAHLCLWHSWWCMSRYDRNITRFGPAAGRLYSIMAGGGRCLFFSNVYHNIIIDDGLFYSILFYSILFYSIRFCIQDFFLARFAFPRKRRSSVTTFYADVSSAARARLWTFFSIHEYQLSLMGVLTHSLTHSLILCSHRQPTDGATVLPSTEIATTTKSEHETSFSCFQRHHHHRRASTSSELISQWQENEWTTLLATLLPCWGIELIVWKAIGGT
jgi:hypothetical protein